MLGKLKAALLALGLENVSIVNSNPTYIEITHKDATKANAIAHVQAAEKITKDQLMAFGDGENDLPMLTAVGTAVVVANASAKIKQVADFISKSNDEDGVAYAIKRLILDAEL
ncbi:HAD family hydrolase [Ligilactobacillus agilis]|uniref:HAD family hydrolase n=1 Tax=Ligilactobacillus agilis TaxID=1601 RepID=UPI0021F08B60|nr:HAD-IIB family hydrolase [Ligilactobacillus agilis]